MNTKQEIYNKVNILLNDTTPLKCDCGQLCNSACCKGDNQTGMILFPDETTDFKVITSNNFRIAVCGGTCDRNKRPISCRIFPFFPTVNDNGKIIVKIDSRGFGICPMVENHDIIRFNHKFIRRIRKAGKILSGDKDILDFMIKISKEIEDYNKDIERLR